MKTAIIALLFITTIGFGQEKTVSGIVRHGTETLPFVNVVIRGTARGTQTDIDGKFTIKANTGDTLVFEYLGFLRQEFVVTGDPEIKIVMKPENVTWNDEPYTVPKKANRPNHAVIPISAIKKATLEGRTFSALLGESCKETTGRLHDQNLLYFFFS